MEKSKNKIKVVFMGTSSFAAEILSALIAGGYDMAGLYTQPDKKVGRDRDLVKSPAKVMAEKYGLPVFQPEKLTEETALEISSLAPDVIVVAAYGKILPKFVLEIPKLGCINAHASLLPRYRGPSPIQNALLMGEKETGVTIMLMDEGIDTGDILSQEKTNIGKDETHLELEKRLSVMAGKMMAETVSLWADGKIKPELQDNSQATICQLIERSDGKIIWAEDAEAIFNKYRAFIPWPGVYTFWEKNKINLRLKLNRISFSPESPNTHHLGDVFESDGKICVKASSGAVILEEVQLEGKSSMKINDFVNGNPTFLESVLK